MQMQQQQLRQHSKIQGPDVIFLSRAIASDKFRLRLSTYHAIILVYSLPPRLPSPTNLPRYACM